MLAIFNDVPIMMIAYDDVPVAERPVRWDMVRVLTMSVFLGVLGVIASFGLFWFAERYLHLPRPTVQTLIFLKLLVAGHLTIYLTRNVGWFWQRPWPNWRLFFACEATQALGTLAAVYGWFVAPIGWELCAAWCGATRWPGSSINNAGKVWIYRAIRGESRWMARHLRALRRPLHRGSNSAVSARIFGTCATSNRRGCAAARLLALGQFRSRHMSIRNLDKMFAPRSIAVIGASDKPNSVGAALMTNLLQAGFAGPVLPVNPKASAVHGIKAYGDIASLPHAPDLAVIATPPDTVPPLIAELGRRGTRAGVILTAGFAEGEAKVGKERAAELLAAARPYLLRIVGPNCLGIAVPGIGVDATFAPAAILPGNIAFLTQSGAMATTVLDWALPRGIGFSAIVSMGDMADVDFGDLLDYFALDEATNAILIYAEAVTEARKFMSAARRAARVKPVIVVKGGRAEEGARAASSHTGALAGADIVYEAAFRRAGMLRVNELEELFDAAATLGRMAPQRGDRLAIVSNGGGAGVLATDRLIAEGGRLAELDADTLKKLDAVLPATWSRANPVDIIGDADARRYTDAVGILMADANVDALLAIYCPTAVASAADAAQGLIGALAPPAARKKNVLACWMGEANVAQGRAALVAAQVPDFETPERAVRAFMYLVRYRQNQDLLLETPASLAPTPPADIARARGLIGQALDDRREWLDPAEVAGFLACYGIAFARTENVKDAKAAGAAAARIAAPVALKIRSRDVIHKSDVGGVALNLAEPRGSRSRRQANERAGQPRAP